MHQFFFQIKNQIKTSSQLQIKTLFLFHFLFQIGNKIKNRIKMAFIKRISRSVRALAGSVLHFGVFAPKVVLGCPGLPPGPFRV